MAQYIGWTEGATGIQKYYRQGKGLYFYIRAPVKMDGVSGWFIKQLPEYEDDWLEWLTIVNKEAYNAVLKDYEERRQESIAATAAFVARGEYEKVDYSTDGDA
jgi:hypothetical protein